ncbi:hypothetical protein VTK73DRAFT_3615 [Phialemonium thermophilum]|uniref:Uncharacterized protein n=1 Tax=Phialemonium thermophilum TaxID=223376 RepID=A0ABR3WYD3_9PEZI
MALPPIVTVTAQSAVIGASSNILAQAITAYRNGSPLSVDWMTVLQFFVYACISTPPNFLW